MRLLRCSDNGDFGVPEVFPDNERIPPYAILSHTWEPGQEVTFRDLVAGTGKGKSGFRKIRFCAQQAKRDGLQYFWVDTCCIDKSKSVELQQAINSMFRWYRNADKCYVYLSDISTTNQGTHITLLWWLAFWILGVYIWEWLQREISTRARTVMKQTSLSALKLDIQQSKWFTRGWTLQELLAPLSVEFFSREWNRLGNKQSLRQKIHEATGIPTAALEGASLSQFSDKERFAWIESRNTTVEEDKAYALLGIFGIEMPLRYGEGYSSASKRLEGEISKLNACLQHLHSTDARDDKKRIEETKGGLLADAYRWVFNNATFQQWQQDSHSQLLWIKGDPGKGKTMLLCGIIDELHRSIPSTTLLSYFFCQATDSRINSATAVLRGLLFMLIDQQPLLVSHVRKKHDRVGKSLFEDANAWIALTKVVIDVLQDPSLRTTYLVIDALDECVTDLSKLLSFIVKQSSVSPRVKWIVSSRNWPDIEAQLERAGRKSNLSLELDAESVATAVGIFIQQKVDQLSQEKQYKEDMQHAVLQHLRLNANDTFLWVALVCQELGRTPRRHVLKKLSVLPPGLDDLYKRMLQQMSESDDAEICWQILASAVILYRPVTILELTALVEPLEGDVNNDLDVREIVGLCGSFLTLRGDTVYFVHQSAKDYLFVKAYEELFPDGIEANHRMIFSRSLATLSRTLHRNMYRLEAIGCPIESALPPTPDPLAASRYPCVYWVDHLFESKLQSLADGISDVQGGGVVDVFLRKKYLYWLEGLSLCKSVGRGVVSMTKLWSLVQDIHDQDELNRLIQDARRFVMYHRGAMESYPLQTYASALLFSPTDSLVRCLFQHEEPDRITIAPAMSTNWGACLQTLEGHNDIVTSVSFSHDSVQLASASHDSTVKIWDSNNGACLLTLTGHSKHANSVAFSRDSTRIVSASDDKTIKIWDVTSGACLQTLEGHSDSVNIVAFSHESTQLASASHDKSIKIWNLSNRACLQTLEGHSSFITSVAFSHDSTQLASTSWDRTIKVWDISKKACLRTLKGHSKGGVCVVFSHDSTRLASASHDKTIKIWEVASGACLQTLEGHSDSVNTVAFSHDSTQLASASHDRTVKIWDVSSGACLQTLEGHSNSVSTVAFSHDSTQLVSASYDKTIKIWDTTSNVYLETLKRHNNSIVSIAFSHDQTRLASASWDNTVKMWDTSSGVYLYTFKGHSMPITSVTFSHDSTQLLSTSFDTTFKKWNISNGVCLQTFNGHSSCVASVIFSHDSTWLASASWDKTIKIWDARSGLCLRTLKGHTDSVDRVTFSHDSNQLASASWDKTVKIWDTNSGECLQTLKGHSDYVISVAFSYNSIRLASTSRDRTIRVWDTRYGACLEILSTSRTVRELSFNSTGSLLNTELGSIAIGRSESFSSSSITKPEPPRYLGVGIGSHGKWITYNGQNILWLSSQYRSSCSSVRGNMIGIGVGSGRVWTCSIDL
ncbi:beta transducin-like protein HET-D2Y [Pyrenochaeta sp. MPI-SDFR-AT-0127]|nr:beta transducin-like protein HET-D2Y [Pyrenochaeta sp. MPI-SDFR-AT-0127]